MKENAKKLRLTVSIWLVRLPKTLNNCTDLTSALTIYIVMRS